MSRLKTEKFKDKSYGKWIHSNLVCCITGQPLPDPHHIVLECDSGMALKQPDQLQMALSHELHTQIHNMGWKAFEEAYGRTQKSMVAETIIAAHALGRLNIEKLAADGHIPDWLADEIMNFQGNTWNA
jgi:hypothetical protein